MNGKAASSPLRWLAHLFALLGLLALAGCSEGKDDLPVLRVGLPNKAGNRALLEATNELKDLPYRIEWSEFTATPALLEAMRSGAVDLGQGGSTAVILESANAASGKLRAIAAANRQGISGQAVLVRKDSPLRSVADLRGKRVAVVSGSLQHYQLVLLLKQHGMTLADIEPLFIGNDVALPALTTGRIDAWLIWDPQRAVVQHREGLRVLAWLGDTYLSPSLQVANVDALADPGKAEMIRDYSRRLVRAHAQVNKRPADLARALERTLGIDAAAALDIAERARQDYVPVGPQEIAALQSEADFWLKEGKLKRPVVVADLIDRRFDQDLKDAIASAGAGSIH